MCELLVRIVDKTNPDSPSQSAKLLKRGDVVVACPDGWPWSTLEQQSTDWRILRVPGVAVSGVSNLTLGQSGKRRDNQLNLDHPSVASLMANGAMWSSFSLNQGQLNAITRSKPDPQALVL